MSDDSKRIAELNDTFRKSPHDRTRGRSYMTDGVSALGPDFFIRAIAAVAAFDQFNADNDPYGEHDFGSFGFGEHTIFWKIDYYDKKLEMGSPDPADPAVTSRVLTVLLSEEY